MCPMSYRKNLFMAVYYTILFSPYIYIIYAYVREEKTKWNYY